MQVPCFRSIAMLGMTTIVLAAVGIGRAQTDSCEDLSHSVCDPAGFTFELIDHQPPPPSNSGSSTWTYQICVNSSLCPLPPQFRDLSHFDFVLPELTGAGGCVSENHQIALTQTGGFGAAELSCAGATQDNFCGQSQVAKCDVVIGDLDDGECVEVELAIVGEQVNVGHGAISVLSKSATNCVESAILGPSCNICEGGGGPDPGDGFVFLLIDEDSIDNGNPPNFFLAADVNDLIAEIGVRSQLRFFAANVGATITLHTGEVGDEGWFAPKSIPASWDAAGPTPDGLRNYLGNPSVAFPHDVGPGLGTPDLGGDREALLDKIPDVTPLRATGLKLLEGKQVCAVVYDSDISINFDPIDGSLKGANLGTVAFEVISVTALTGHSSSSLPKVEIEILDAEDVCERELELITDAPEPESSSEPFDVAP